MADAYSSDDEQLEALKKWWRENGRSTVTTILLVLAGVFGWKAWQQQQDAEIEASSMMYQNLLAAVSINGGQLSPSQQATAAHLADTLKQDFPKSSYANYAALFKAQFAVNNQQLDQAEEELNWVLANNPGQEIYLQANLRLARVYAAQGKTDEALGLLSIDAGAYAAGYEEVKGDIQKSQGQLEQALISYQKAQQLSQQTEQPIPNRVLNLKLKHLANQLADSEEGAE